jgi:hypothetical protein
MLMLNELFMQRFPFKKSILIFSGDLMTLFPKIMRQISTLLKVASILTLLFRIKNFFNLCVATILYIKVIIAFLFLPSGLTRIHEILGSIAKSTVCNNTSAKIIYISSTDCDIANPGDVFKDKLLLIK